MTYAAFSPVVFWFFVLVGATITILLTVKAVQGFRAHKRKAPIVIKAAAAFILWLILSLGILIWQALIFWAAGHSRELLFVEQKALIGFIVTNLLWAAVGCGLIYWMHRQTKTELE